MSARDEIIARIRTTKSAAPATRDAPTYRQKSDADRAALIALFAQRLADYHVTVLRARGDGDIRDTASRQLAARGITSLVVPPDLQASWRPVDPAPLADQALTLQQLNATQGAMTGSLMGIAETGTVVLDGGPGQGRRALTLLPDYHLCVVRESSVVGIMPEAISILQPRVVGGAPITFFSGPSATADIELDRVVGVHGPRTLDVILVG
jgi:L-lactate dehydrogenase complex protein LldG